ncbi:MAG: ADP-ribosylglycohydrolase family protein [Lachnospiraceae bacterium]|nr:ADP-ribosylglycohydrolase family protein [Lachnospiraceae bacterium]
MSKIYDGILGVAIGDALGVPVEFESRAAIAIDPVITMREYGTHHQPAGTWSDDTSLTLALMDSINKNQGLDYYDIMDKFSEWLLYGEYTANGEVFDVGNATSRAIMNYGRRCEPLKCGGVSEFENGNGSLMRILPTAFYINAHSELTIDERMGIIHNISSLTHRHPISLIGCGIYISIALSFISGKTPLSEGIQQGIAEAFRYYENQCWSDISSYLRLKDATAFKNLSENDIQSSGYVVHTLEAAIWCLLHTDSYESCVLRAVNLGDDTDTTGAVAGGLAGIYYGADSIPQEWQAAVAKREYIKHLCTAFEDCISAKPPEYDQ